MGRSTLKLLSRKGIFLVNDLFLFLLCCFEESNDKDLSFKLSVCGHRISIFNYFPWMKYTGLSSQAPLPFLSSSPLGGRLGRQFPEFSFHVPSRIFSAGYTHIFKTNVHTHTHLTHTPKEQKIGFKCHRMSA